MALSKQLKKKKKKRTESYSYFDYLSSESVFNICEYLDEQTLTKFKATSSFIALTIFELMSAYRIGVFNCNELIEQNEYKYPLHLNLNKKIKVNYFQPFCTHKTLTTMYSKRYDIPLPNMLILQSFKSHGFSMSMGIDFGIYNNSLCKSQIVENMQLFNAQKIEQKREFFIFDTRKIIVLNNENRLQTMDKYHYDKDYNIALLQYFDLQSQRLQNVQFIYLHKLTTRKRFESYIVNSLYSVYTVTYKRLSNEWCLSLLRTMHQMMQMNDFDNVINIYLRKRVNVNYCDYVPYDEETYNYRRKGSEYDNDFTILVFELNAKHSFFKHADFGRNEMHNSPFYHNVSRFMTDKTQQTRIQIEYLHSLKRLKAQLKHFDNEYDEITTNVGVKITPLCTFLMIKQQICAQFDNIFGVGNVLIFRVMHHGSFWKTSSWNNEFNNAHSHIASVECDDCQIGNGYKTYNYMFEIVANIEEDCIKKYNIYNVSMYDKKINDFEDLLNGFDTNNASKQIHIRYRKDLTALISAEQIVEENEQRNDTTPEFVPLSLSNMNNEFEEKSKASPEFVAFSSLKPKNRIVSDLQTMIEIDVSKFVGETIDAMSHKMYANEYDEFIQKYMKKDDYSFVIGQEKENDFMQCFDSMYVHMERFYEEHNTNYLSINVLIIPHIKWLNDENEKYPLIMRLREENDSNNVFGGYPLKIWITKQCKLHNIFDGLFENSKQFELSLCGQQIDKDTFVYSQLYDSSFDTPELLMTVKRIF